MKSEAAGPSIGWLHPPCNLRAEIGDSPVVLLSNFTSEHTAELGLGQGIRMLGWLGIKVRFLE